MRQVLYPKYLLGGMLRRESSGAEGGENMRSLAGGYKALRGMVGRWPDADVVLQGGMSEGLRDWDLWYDNIIPLCESNWLIRVTGGLFYSACFFLSFSPLTPGMTSARSFSAESSQPFGSPKPLSPSRSNFWVATSLSSSQSASSATPYFHW